MYIYIYISTISYQQLQALQARPSSWQSGAMPGVFSRFSSESSAAQLAGPRPDPKPPNTYTCTYIYICTYVYAYTYIYIYVDMIYRYRYRYGFSCRCRCRYRFRYTSRYRHRREKQDQKKRDSRSLPGSAVVSVRGWYFHGVLTADALSEGSGQADSGPRWCKQCMHQKQQTVVKTQAELYNQENFEQRVRAPKRDCNCGPHSATEVLPGTTFSMSPALGIRMSASKRSSEPFNLHKGQTACN